MSYNLWHTPHDEVMDKQLKETLVASSGMESFSLRFAKLQDTLFIQPLSEFFEAHWYRVIMSLFQQEKNRTKIDP